MAKGIGFAMWGLPFSLYGFAAQLNPLGRRATPALAPEARTSAFWNAHGLELAACSAFPGDPGSTPCSRWASRCQCQQCRDRGHWPRNSLRQQPATTGRSSSSSKADAVRPAKAGAFCGSQSHRGKSRSPVAWVAGLQLGNRDSEAYRRAIVRMAASHQAVAQANERWPRNYEAPEAEPAVTWRRQHGSSRTG